MRTKQLQALRQILVHRDLVRLEQVRLEQAQAQQVGLHQLKQVHHIIQKICLLSEK